MNRLFNKDVDFGTPELQITVAENGDLRVVIDNRIRKYPFIKKEDFLRSYSESGNSVHINLNQQPIVINEETLEFTPAELANLKQEIILDAMYFCANQ